MDRHQLARALNEWMRRYTVDPSAFEAEFQGVLEFLREQEAGLEPTYGEGCVVYLESIVADLSHAEVPSPPPSPV